MELTDTLPESEQCLQKLHSLPAVQNSFKVELEKGFKGLFGKDERREIISTVCKINRVIYDAKQTAGENITVWISPLVNTGDDKVDPLRDGRVAKVLCKLGMEHCWVTPWSFGQEDEKGHKLKCPRGIATNADGQFLIADDGIEVKVFNRNGNFVRKFKARSDTGLYISDVATDKDSKIYVLVTMGKTMDNELYMDMEVQVFTKAAVLQHKFPLNRGDRNKLAVSNNKVLVLRNKDVVDVYEHDGEFVCSFGEGILKDARDITAAGDGRVLIVDRGTGEHDNCVHLFTVEGEEQSMFYIGIKELWYYDRIAFHTTGEHVVVATVYKEEFQLGFNLVMAIYTQAGEFVRSIQEETSARYHPGWEAITGVAGITVTMDGQIAVALCGYSSFCDCKVIVF